MAPTGLIDRIKAYYSGEVEKELPPITTSAATGILVLYAFLYVAPFYISSTTRPSPQLSRDAPSVIRGRISAVTLSCIICSVSTFVLLASVEHGGPLLALHSMGYLPPGFSEAAKCMVLTSILFLGPLFEAAIVEGAWRDWICLRGAGELFSSWMGYRNLVAGPITEEVLFRSAAVPLFLLSKAPLKTVIFGTPIIFGLAHIHHFYEFRITHPHTPVIAAILRSVFQLAYTTLFGAYATFLYIRTGSLLAVILVHAFCNWMGLPRLWGRVGAIEPLVRTDNGQEVGKRDEDKDTPTKVEVADSILGIGWTVTYYVILVIGAFGFWKELWVLTESASALAPFTEVQHSGFEIQ